MSGRMLYQRSGMSLSLSRIFFRTAPSLLSRVEMGRAKAYAPDFRRTTPNLVASARNSCCCRDVSLNNDAAVRVMNQGGGGYAQPVAFPAGAADRCSARRRIHHPGRLAERGDTNPPRPAPVIQ